MKIRDVAKQYNLDPDLFEHFLNTEYVVPLTGFMGNIIDDSDIPKAIAAFDQFLTAKNENEYEAKQKEAEFNHSVENIILSTCPSIDGYRVVKQLGLVFGECLFKASFISIFDSGVSSGTSTSKMMNRFLQ